MAFVESAFDDEPGACAHCGLSAPGDVAPGELAFCCAGCNAAWSLLHDAGLARFYRLGERRRAPVEPSGRSFAEFDGPAFHRLWVEPAPGARLATDLYLEGVHCASCVWVVERTPQAVPGFERAELDAARGVVRLVWDPAIASLSSAARFLDTIGYRPHPYRGATAERRRRDEDRRALVDIGIAGAIAANVMLAAVALYSGAFAGMDPSFERLFRWVSLVVTLPSLLGPGRTFFRGAWSSVATRTLHMDVPIALALGAGFLRGAVNTVRGAGPVYFDGVAMLIFLLLVGRFFQRRAQRRAAGSAELLYALSPSCAHVVEGGSTRTVPAAALLSGMTCEVLDGEVVPADGFVVSGHSTLDRSLLTGESRPSPVTPGDVVHAGTTNRGAAIRVRVEQAGETTRVARILREVERGAARRAPVVRAADRLAGGFVFAVLVLAAITWAVWSRIDPSRALDHAVSLLIVTCPCALALATPAAITIAIGRAARSGILVKGGDALEALARPATLVLDKTGTLTEGRTTLVEWTAPEDCRALVLALERESSHPIAEGFRAAWPAVEGLQAREVHVTTGGGIEGWVDGRSVVVGSPAFVRAHAEDPEAMLDSLDGEGAHTPVAVAVDGRVVAHARFGDAIRPDARPTLDALRARGWRLRLLSGDDGRVVAAVGRKLGFAPEECTGGATPEAKLRAIESLAASGPVVMVGDGINDAAAIARATVGIGVRGGAEACVAAADVFLARPGLAPLLELVRGARRTMSTIRGAIAFSLVYNLAGATLAVSGAISPFLAAILMPASSLTVILYAWQRRSFAEVEG